MSTVIDQRNHRNLCYRQLLRPQRGLEAAPWRAVYLHPRYEGGLGPALTEKGYEVFLPTCKSGRLRDRTDMCPLNFLFFQGGTILTGGRARPMEDDAQNSD